MSAIAQAVAPGPADTPRLRTPTVLQLESVECGAAALAMVLAYHGRHVPLEVLRVECGVSRDGSKASGIVRAARGYGLVARGFKKETRDLASLPLPAIVFWNFNHFVVLEGFRRGRALLNDPARGRRTVDARELDQAFTGVVLTFEPGPDFEPGGQPPSILRSLRPHAKGLEGVVALAVVLGLTLALPGLALPWLMGRFVDDVLVARMGGVALPLAAGFLAAALARSLLLWLQARVLTLAFGRVARVAATRFLERALSLPMEFYSQRSPGEIAARIDLNDRVAETVTSDLSTLLLDLLTASFFLVLMTRLEPRLTLVVAGCVAIEMVAWRALAARTAEFSQQISVQAGKLSGMASGALANIEGIKAGGQERALFLKWLGLHVQFVNTAASSQRATLALEQAPVLLALAAQLAVLGIGSMAIVEGTFSVGDLVAFQVLLAGFTAPVQALFGATQEVQTLKGDLARLDDVLNYSSGEMGPRTVAAEVAASGETKDFVSPDAPAGALVRGPVSSLTLEFRDVTFGYDRGAGALIEDLSLKVEPGQRIAIVGASGSGKSTVARLAAGLFHPWSGEILYNGHARAQWDRASLAAAMAFVDQDVVLFEGTVRENLSLWNDAVPEEALRKALADAAIADVVLAREGGLEARLEEGARNLSGGQRQRLEIARALVRSPALLILDEATSALDPASEAEVERNLRRRGVTCLVIAHRLSTVRDADEILVVEEGRVVERGRHAELAARPEGRYAALVANEADED